MSSIATAVLRARGHLARTHIKHTTLRNLPLILGVAALAAVARPFVWPLHDEAPARAVVRVLVLVAAGSVLVVVGSIVYAWRHRPSLLVAARRIDDRLGLAEVVASGFAFERDRRDGDMAALAVQRARRALEEISLERLLATQLPSRTPKERRWLALAATLAVFGIAFGAIDRLVVERVFHPMTAPEKSAAAQLERSANEAVSHTAKTNPKAEEVATAARRASQAAERGDRKRALEALDQMRDAARAVESDERERSRALRALRDELEGGNGRDGHGDERPARPTATASDALDRMMTKELEAARTNPDARKSLSERLERAEAAAKRNAKADSSRSSSAWSRAADALKEAREATARGDTEAAKRALERAEREISSLEKMRDEGASAAVTRMMDEGSELDRLIQSAMRGEPTRMGGKESKGEESTTAKGSSPSKDSRKGKPDPSGAPGAGPGDGDRTPGAEQRRIAVNGNLQARTTVNEGERAVSVIAGMGRGGNEGAYREIFPSYDTVVEDGLREELVPAARRPAVRRYFSLIRPGNEPPEAETKSRKAP